MPYYNHSVTKSFHFYPPIAKPLYSLLFLSVNSDQRKRKCWLFLTNLWPRVPRLFRVLNRNRSRLWKMGFWPTTLALSTLALSLSISPLRASLPTRSKIRTHSYPGILQSIYPISLTHQQTENMVYPSCVFSWFYGFRVDLILVILGSVWFLARNSRKNKESWGFYHRILDFLLGLFYFVWFIIKKMRLLSVGTKWQLPFLTDVWWSLDYCFFNFWMD